MRLAAACLAVLVGASAAGAATVAVRSGAHEGFTRLTMDLPRRLGWALNGSGARRTLRLDGTDLDFDLSQAFTRIGRDRVRALSGGGEDATLVIDLGCDCDVDGFFAGESLLVIDIADPPAP